MWHPRAPNHCFHKRQHRFNSLDIGSSLSQRREHFADEPVFTRTDRPEGFLFLQVDLGAEKPIDGPWGVGDLGDPLEHQCVGDLSRLPLGHCILGVVSSRFTELFLGHLEGKPYLFDIITDSLIGKLSQCHGILVLKNELDNELTSA